MFSANRLTKAIEDQLRAWVDLNDTYIGRSQRVNSDPNRMPWIGIYPGTVDTDPSTLGSRSEGKRWKEVMHPKLIIQAQNLKGDGTEAADELDSQIEICLLALDSNLTFGISGVRLVSMSREYTYLQTDEDEEGDLFFPQCEITLTVEVRSNG